MGKMISLTVIEISELAKVGKYNCRRKTSTRYVRYGHEACVSWMITTTLQPKGQ